MLARMGARVAGVAAAVAVMSPGGVWAQPAPPANALACGACHGPQGVSVNPAIPNLAGQKPAYLEAQLKAFRGKVRRNDIMEPIAGQLSDAEIHELAAYWSGLSATPAAQGKSAAILSRMTFPAGFPAGFTLYSSAEEDGLIHRRYANAVAFAAAKAGAPLPSGSIVVGVDHKAEKDAAGKTVAGQVVSYRAMESRAGWGAEIPALLRNGDWDYALFDKDRQRRDALNQAQCLSCHKPREADSYLFTAQDLRAAAGK